MKKKYIISAKMNISKNGNYNMLRLSPSREEGCKKRLQIVPKEQDYKHKSGTQAECPD